MREACWRVFRLMEMIQLFRDGHQFTTVQLAERFEVTPSTIRRDLIVLQTDPLFVPLICDCDGWRLLKC
ncbi:MAG TPA: DeoR family transcriptional regulator [Verrucomicrobiota bacterium]|nr:DeoR family transcriptional regulator [Verrucomicrobiota bacterium]